MSVILAIHDEPGSFSDRWIEYCHDHALTCVSVDCRADGIVNQLRGMDALLWNWSHISPADQLLARQVLVAMEAANLVVFPNATSSWRYDDKIAQKYLLEAIDAPLAPAHVFVDREAALAWIDTADFPKVFKLRCGAGSQNVRFVKDRKNAVRLCKVMFGRGLPGTTDLYFSDWRRKWRGITTIQQLLAKVGRMLPSIWNLTSKRHLLPRQLGYIYFQDYLAGNTFDTRVTVIGGRAFAFRRFNRPGDFRASGSGIIAYDTNEIDQRCLRIALDTAQRLDAQSIAFDFLFDENREPKILETSYTYVAKAVYQCSGYWDEQLQWHEGHFWPQDLILEDVLEAVRKKKHV